MNIRRIRPSERRALRTRRTLSTLTAAAVLGLMVFGSGAAFADDTPTPSPTAPASPDPSSAPAAQPPALTPPSNPAAAPADVPAAPAPQTPSAPQTTSAPATTSTPSIKTAASSVAVRPQTSRGVTLTQALAPLAVPCVGGPGTVVGGFEIDGNTCVQGNQDWDTTGSTVVDGFGDSSTFAGGTSEGDNPAGWALGGPAPNGKTDIGQAWAYSQVSGGTVYGYFALTNASDTGGTSQYDVEYNQLNPVGGMPNRSPGDLLFRFSSTGSDPITFTDAKKWTLKSAPAWGGSGCHGVTTTAGWCTIPIPAGVFAQSVSADGTFFEGAINISLLFGSGNCSGTFGTVDIRSVTGHSFYDSSLKDYVTPLGVNTPSTCGKIVINKQDLGGAPLAGATFTVSPNPDPSKSDATPYSITDNDPKDGNPANGVIEISPVDPNQSYTVTETTAPTGYLLADPAAQGPTLVGPSQTVTFTFNDPLKWKALTATKSATPTYTATYHWTMVKEIAASPNGPWYADTSAQAALIKKVAAAGDPTPGTLYYRVTATEGARTTSDYKVSGDISVTNPNSGAVTASLTDSLPGATCLVEGNATDSVSVPSGTTAYPYVCTFAGVPSAGQLTGTNSALVQWKKSDYPQTQADLGDSGNYMVNPTHAYAFGAETTSVDKTVTITDDHHVFSPALTYTWSAEGQQDVSPTYTRDTSAAPGTCSAVLDNTATLTGDGVSGVADDHVITTDSAYGQLCVAADLSITRLDVRAFTRTFPWAIQKATTTPKVTEVGGVASADYQVTVTAGAGTDTDWAMSGTITAHNPNSFEAVSVTSVPVAYTGGGTCAVTGASFPLSIPAGGSHDFAYSCNFGAQPSYAGTINATVNWDATAAATPDATVTDGLAVTEADWTKTLVNNTVTIHDDHASGANDTIATLDWATVYAMPNHQDVITYTTPLSGLPDGGTCADKVNTVWVEGDGGVHLDSDQNAANNSATVQVCNPIGLSVGDTAVGDFTRTYHWKIDKFINGDQKSQTVSVDAFDHTFDYKVLATPLDRVDSAWTVTGTVTVTNDNTDPAIDPITVTDVTDQLSVGTTSHCTYDTSFPFDLASNGHKDVGFTCTLDPTPTNNGAEPPVYGGTHQGHVTWGATGSATSTANALSWNAPTEVDKTISVYDNKVSNIALPVLLGDANWNAAGTPTEFDYQLNLTVPDSTAGTCAPPFVNTAWLGGNGINPTDLQSNAQAIICVNAGTWTVSKVNLAGNGPMPVDSDVTYRLTAHKTGGVDPKNVVLTDDLSAIAPYLTGDPSFTAPDGTTVTYDSGTHLLTWTIADLGSTDRTLDFTVHVKADAYGVDLPNLVTSPGSTNCPDVQTASGVADCKTDNDTPSYTLVKSSSVAQGGTVMPPYLGAPATTITYTLHVHNNSNADINPTTLPGAQVTDDLSNVLDNATFVAGSIDPADQAQLSGNTLTWTLPVIPAGGDAFLTYQVTVNADQWDQTLTNVATPGDGGKCLPVIADVEVAADANCTTTSVTPPYTQISVLKEDYETGAPLAGAEFSLSQGDTVIGTATSGADGIAVFAVKLQPGDYTVTETKAPDGYDLPPFGTDVQQIHVDAPGGEGSNFVVDGVMAPFTFLDPAQGQIAIVSKQHFERDPATNGWVPSDGAVDFGQQVRYVVNVTATGKKLFHNVTVTDYVPGYNPADTTSTGKSVLDPSTVTCGGDFTCTATEDMTTGLVTWTLTSPGQAPGDVVGGTSGEAEMTVTMPALPDSPPYVNGVYSDVQWNQGYLAWDQQDPVQAPDLALARGSAVQQTTHHSLSSNEVTDEARAFEPSAPTPTCSDPNPPASLHCKGEGGLPNTGGPASWLLYLALGLTLGGVGILAGDRRHWRRS